jgi:hypothetical protein
MAADTSHGSPKASPLLPLTEKSQRYSGSYQIRSRVSNEIFQMSRFFLKKQKYALNQAT